MVFSHGGLYGHLLLFYGSNQIPRPVTIPLAVTYNIQPVLAAIDNLGDMIIITNAFNLIGS
jgi:hypothetical protein